MSDENKSEAAERFDKAMEAMEGANGPIKLATCDKSHKNCNKPTCDQVSFVPGEEVEESELGLFGADGMSTEQRLQFVEVNESDGENTSTMDVESTLRIIANKFTGIEGLVNVVRFAKADEATAIARSHHGIGRTLRNELGLWEENELTVYFNGLGITHADDMSGILLTSFHRKLNGRIIAIDGQIEEYKEFWAKQDAESECE